jgi:hypothetical protein
LEGFRGHAALAAQLGEIPMKLITRMWKNHGTKILGYVTSAIPALIAIDGLIPPASHKYWLAASVLLGLLVVQRGHQNSKQATP